MERVPEITMSHLQPHNLIHYMPHLPVIRKEWSTTKVYDGSARSSGNNLLLNDCLRKGPKLAPKLLNVLIWFCNYPVALIADIEKAILMIGIDEDDCDVLRFLWYQAPFKPNSKFIPLQYTRLLFGHLPSSAILGNWGDCTTIWKL